MPRKEFPVSIRVVDIASMVDQQRHGITNGPVSWRWLSVRQFRPPVVQLVGGWLLSTR